MAFGAGIIGHERVISFFEKVIERGALHHAYCFAGPEQVGKRTVAQAIAAELLKTEPARLLASPDYSFVERGVDEKTGKHKKDVAIDQIRDVIGRLSQSSFERRGWKVAIIDDAEYLNQHAASALLKTLEEPGARTIIFLIVRDQRMLPSTVISRCQVIRFTPTKEVMHEARGLPGLAQEWKKAPDAYQEHLKEVERLTSMIGKPFFEKMQCIDELFGDKTDHIHTREGLVGVLDIWHLVIRDALCRAFGVVSLYEKGFTASPARLISIEREIQKAKELLGKNIHPRLLVEQIVLQLP